MKEYYISTNRAGYMSLKLKGEHKDTTVLPLGMNKAAANAAAVAFVNQLADPSAKLCLAPEATAHLMVKLPFREHKGKTVAEVLRDAPDYLRWIYRTFDGSHEKFGDVWRALHALAGEKDSGISNVLSGQQQKPPEHISNHLGAAGQGINIRAKVLRSFKLNQREDKAKSPTYQVVLADHKGNVLTFYSSGMAARICSSGTQTQLTQTVIISGVVEKHEYYKDRAQTRIAKTNLHPVSKVSVQVRFKHEANISELDIATQLRSYRPIANELFAEAELLYVERLRGGNGTALGLQESIAFFNCGCYLVLTNQEVTRYINDYADTHSLPGILGLEVSPGCTSGIITSTEHEAI